MRDPVGSYRRKFYKISNHRTKKSRLFEDRQDAIRAVESAIISLHLRDKVGVRTSDKYPERIYWFHLQNNDSLWTLTEDEYLIHTKPMIV